MKTRNSRREGLILLIVLGMLSLFSLLAISFMVISSQSRAANAGRANRDFRGTAPEKLLDSAMRVALRGTTDGSSFLRGQGLLADLHGIAEAPIRLRVRSTIWGVSSNSLPPNQTQAYSNPITHNVAERPLLLANRFLRIPIVSSLRDVAAEVPRDDTDFPTTPNPNPITDPRFDLPFEHDAWTSRVATFLSGPLQGESFRIVRYIGYEPTTDGTAPSLQQSYSITIDLQDASRRLATIGSNTRSIEEWAIQTPPGGGAVKRGLFLCYGNVPTAGNVRLTGGYEILINAAPLNSHGVGINGNLNNPGGVSVPDSIAPIGSPLDTALSSVDPNLRNMPAALQPNRNAPNTPPLPAIGDADEDYDAADYQNFYLSHRYSGATNGTGIIPSFHRAALINYIVNAKDPRNYENGELYAAVTRILRAAGRPLSVRAIDQSASNPVTGGPLEVFTNPDFSGSNSGQFNLANDERSTQLDCVWESLTSWQDPGNPRGVTAFLDWVRWLTKGPWDVDSDGDGVYDSIWTDPNLPLTTSREGKLLKVLVSYQIESLDSRLDLNATGNLTQTVAPTAYGQPTNTSYAVGANVQLAQGMGRGPAEVSLRHLFGTSGANNYRTFLESRYQGQMPNGSGVLVGEALPGVIGNDVRSQLNQREIRPTSSHSFLPALPTDSSGRIALGLDRMGNPLMVNSGLFTLPPFAGRPAVSLNDIFNDHYETSLLSGARGDNLFTIAEWERMLRPNDWDRSTLPRRLNQVFDAPRAVTPRSRHLRHTPAGVSRTTGQQSHSMYELVRDMFAFNPPDNIAGTAFTTPLSYNAYRELFPLEFHQGQGLNINRPLGNGVDDDGDGNIDEADEAGGDGIDNDGDGAVDELDERVWDSFQQRTYTSISGNTPVSIALPESPIPGKVNVGGTIYDRGILDGNLDPTFEALANAALSGGAADSDSDGQADVDTLRYHFGLQSRQLLARNLYSLAMLILPDDLYLSNVPNTSPVTGHERARRIAQWAVNVVDFRDADSAMTRFPYDPDPFTPDPTTGAYWLPNPAAGHVVWGMEQPDAVLTESLATHDLRVDDTTDDSTGNDITGGDPHKDQVRMPEGSAFLEVLALRTTSGAADTSTPGVSNSLYSLNGTNRELNLSSLSPPIDITPSGGGTAVTTRYPVFRVAISEPHADPAADLGTPLALQAPANASQRQSTTYQLSEYPAPTPPETPNQSGLVWDTSNINNTQLSAAADSPYEIDRVLIFAPWSTNIGVPGLPSTLSAAAIAGRVYSNYNTGGADVTLQGGEYLVVGPREITYFGSRSGGGHSHQPNPHRIALSDSIGGSTPAVVNQWATVYGTDPTTTTTNQRVDKRAPTRLVKSMIAGQPAPWAEAVPMQSYLRPNYIGFNVSAPYGNSYYQAPTDQLDSTDMGPDSVTGAPGFGTANMPADAYYDYGTLGGTVGTSVPDEPFDGVGNRPLSSSTSNNHQWLFRDAGMQPEPGTAQNWCTAYLQRLADPDRPWHRDLNPYITLDWIPIDLTVFSGEDGFTMPAGRDYQFATRQKTGSMALTAGGYQPLTATDTLRTFLSYDTTELSDSVPLTTSMAHFDVELPMDWASGGVPSTNRPTLNSTTPNHVATLGYLNSTFQLSGETSGTSVAGFLGAPSSAPAALFWLDRQYTNPLEMAWAPLSAPGQLMQEFSAPLTSTTTGAYANAQAPSDYTHLPNFFRAVPAQTGAATENQLAAATLFDLVETPSPWIDAEEFVPPADIAFTASPGNVTQQAVNYIFEPLRAPYNRLSRFTEPGRVNINDISEPAVWQGVMWNALPLAARNQIANNPTFWNELQISRAGYTPGVSPNVIGSPNPLLDANSPSQFGGVFKSSFAAGMVPSIRNMQALDGIARNTSGQLERPGNVTLMRSDTSNTPLFRPDYSAFSLASRQPFMDYLPFTRLSNLVTTRSNVFSVRVTIGMFEFNSATGLGREYGLDEGTAQRHSAFYVIDRSIPVGYQEGLDLNTDNCVLMRRVIE